MKIQSKQDGRIRRHLRIRNKISGTAERPRMAVFRSNKNLYVQFIDDHRQVTLAHASTRAGALKGLSAGVETARKVGEEAAKAARAAGIESVVFDRGGFKYGGQIQALADAAREAGLKF